MSGEVELRNEPKVADARVTALVAAVNAERMAGFPTGRPYLDSVEQALALALIAGHAVGRRPVRCTEVDLAQGACEGSWT